MHSSAPRILCAKISTGLPRRSVSLGHRFSGSVSAETVLGVDERLRLYLRTISASCGPLRERSVGILHRSFSGDGNWSNSRFTSKVVYKVIRLRYYYLVFTTTISGDASQPAQPDFCFSSRPRRSPSSIGLYPPPSRFYLLYKSSVMSVNHAAHMPQSLPSFAQAFSSSSLNNISPNDSNALPPIQSHSYERTRHTPSPPSQAPSRHASVDQTRTSKKRSCEDPLQMAHGERAVDSRQSPRAVKIKEEEDREVLQVTAPSPPQAQEMSQGPGPAFGAQHPSKKRRVTVSGTPHPPNAPVRAHVDQTDPTPVSPTDDPSAREEARSVLAVRQQPTAPAEQRRGSIALSAGQNASVSGNVSRSPPEDHLSASRLANLPRIGRRSPNTIAGVSRTAVNTGASGAQAMGRLSPPPMLVPSQQPLALVSSQIVGESPKVQQSTIAHSLPPPPISFARRRAAVSGGRKKKPADILISPRGTDPSDPLAPVIQSAPPVADPGRFPMAIPRLPVDLNSMQTTRRVAGNVPPTPTRFALQHTAAPTINSTARPGTSGLSPPTASVPIASSLVPPTPSALQHPGYAGDKSAFLAPFGVFYDALNDSKQLKNWLADQLQKSNVLMQALKQQQERMDEIVDDLVEKRTCVMREEISLLRQRMESLEEVVLAGRGDAAGSRQSAGGFGYLQGTKFPQNLPGPDSSSTYRFPASEQRRPEAMRRVTSPGGMQERELQQSPPPALEAARRPSISGGHPDSLRMHTTDSQQLQGSHSFGPPGSHGRGVPLLPSSTKGTPPLRTQAVPERSSGMRQTDQRPAARH